MCHRHGTEQDQPERDISYDPGKGRHCLSCHRRHAAACGLRVSFLLAILTLASPSRDAITHLINDVLLALTILELLWTVIRFLKKQKFLLAPFLAIGIIAAVRRILLIEAQTSFMEHVPTEKLYEIVLRALVVITLMIAYYLSVKAQKMEQ